MIGAGTEWPGAPSAGDVAAALGPWLAIRFAAHRVEVRDAVRRTEGYSWQTYTALASWAGADGALHERGIAVRRQPAGGLLGPYDTAGQYRLHEALLPTEIPVPGLVGLELDPDVLGMPFYVMDLVTGIVPVQWRGDDPEVFPDAERRRSIGRQFTDTLAAIHGVDWEAAGLDALLPGTGAVDPGTAEIDRWERFLDDSLVVDVPVLRTAIGWCRRNVALSGRRVLCHGDYRIGNFMVRDGRIVAVFDWELAHIGDPVEDIAWANLRLFRGRSPLVSQLLAPDELFSRYAAATGTAVDPDVLRFWTVLGMVKAAAPHIRATTAFKRRESGDLRLAAMGHQSLHLLGHLAREIGLVA